MVLCFSLQGLAARGILVLPLSFRPSMRRWSQTACTWGFKLWGVFQSFHHVVDVAGRTLKFSSKKGPVQFQTDCTPDPCSFNSILHSSCPLEPTEQVMASWWRCQSAPSPTPRHPAAWPQRSWVEDAPGNSIPARRAKPNSGEKKMQ